MEKDHPDRDTLLSFSPVKETTLIFLIMLLIVSDRLLNFLMNNFMLLVQLYFPSAVVRTMMGVVSGTTRDPRSSWQPDTGLQSTPFQGKVS